MKINKILIQTFQTPFGALILGSIHDKLCLCDWKYRKKRSSINQRIMNNLNAIFEDGENHVIRAAKQQLNEYFNKERRLFDLPLEMVGTDFQQRVWKESLMIPFGKTESYLAIARKISDEKAVRAVAAANGANAISIIVPCHRVIGSHGELTGYAGGINVKKELLQLESNIRYPEQLQLFQ